MDKNTIIVRKKYAVSTDIDKEIVVMDMDSNQYLSFNKIGTRIWELMKDPISIEDICNELLKEYNVNSKVCYNEVCSFLEGLKKEKIIN